MLQNKGLVMQNTELSVDDKIQALLKLKIDDVERDLWVAYWHDPCNERRDDLVEYYVPWVRLLALKNYMGGLPGCVDADSVLQAGCIAMVGAIGKYNGSTKFKTYALIRVRGAAVDELRRADVVPRSVRVRVKRRNELEDNGLNPEDHMSSKELKGSVPIVVDSLDKVIFNLHGKDVTIKDDLFCKSEKQRLDVDDGFRDLCKLCTLEEQTVLFLYYFKDQTMGFIGEALNLSQTRVSQIHANVIKRLRARGQN